MTETTTVTPSEFIELSAAQMRKQFDMFSAQNKELCALAQTISSIRVEGRNIDTDGLVARHKGGV
jgi:hypothetical protein